MPFIGADPGMLDEKAALVRANIETLELADGVIVAACRQINWSGDDADDFIRDIDKTVRPRLRDISSRLVALQQLLGREADQQRLTSRADTSGLGSIMPRLTDLGTAAMNALAELAARATGALGPLSDKAGRDLAAQWPTMTDAERNQLIGLLGPGYSGNLELTRLIAGYISSLSPEEAHALFEGIALDEANIDMGNWNPNDGLGANRGNVEKVYEYYAELYRSDPDRYKWAGMAALIGASFYGGFQDLHALGDATWLLERLSPPGTQIAASVLHDDLEYYEHTMLEMQRQIFQDQ